MNEEVFKQWVASFAGCDGGNLKESTWICGIEYGIGDTAESLKENLDRGAIENPNFIKNHKTEEKDFFRYPYNRRATKLLAAVAGQDCENYKKFFIDKELFGENSQSFKLNLFPVAFKDTNEKLWIKEFKNLTGLETKNDYINFCKTNRFPWLTDLVKEYNPKLILCTGISLKEKFKDAFGGTDCEFRFKTAANKKLYYTWINDNKTLLVVTYFLGGRYGLVSGTALQETGQAIRIILCPQK